MATTLPSFLRNSSMRARSRAPLSQPKEPRSSVPSDSAVAEPLASGSIGRVLYLASRPLSLIVQLPLPMAPSPTNGRAAAQADVPCPGNPFHGENGAVVQAHAFGSLAVPRDPNDVAGRKRQRLRMVRRETIRHLERHGRFVDCNARALSV